MKKNCTIWKLMLASKIIVTELEKIANSIRWQLGDNILNLRGHENRKPGRHAIEKTKTQHRAIGKEVKIENQFSSKYSSSGNTTLTNGILGSLDYNDGEYLGFQGTDFSVIIDLGELTGIQKISCGFMENQKSWIFLPKEYRVSYSADGKTYKEIKKIQLDAQKQTTGRSIERLSAEFPTTEMRFIKIQAINSGPCPNWHSSAGGKTWLFVDEIGVW